MRLSKVATISTTATAAALVAYLLSDSAEAAAFPRRLLLDLGGPAARELRCVSRAWNDALVSRARCCSALAVASIDELNNLVHDLEGELVCRIHLFDRIHEDSADSDDFDDSDDSDDAIPPVAPPLFDPNLVTSLRIAYHNIGERSPHTATLVFPHFNNLRFLHLEACFPSDFLQCLSAPNVRTDLIEDLSLIDLEQRQPWPVAAVATLFSASEGSRFPRLQRLTIGAEDWTVNVSDGSGDEVSDGSSGGGSVANPMQRAPLECLTVRLASSTVDSEDVGSAALLRALSRALGTPHVLRLVRMIFKEIDYYDDIRIPCLGSCFLPLLALSEPGMFPGLRALDLVAWLPLWRQNDSWLSSLLHSRPDLERLTISERPTGFWSDESDAVGDAAFAALAERARRGVTAIRLSDCMWMRRERVQALDGLPNVEVVWSPQD